MLLFQLCEILYLTCFFVVFRFMLDAIGDQTESMWGRGDDMKTELA